MLYLHYLWCHANNFDSVCIYQQEEVWQKHKNSKQTNFETQAIPLPEMLVKPNSSVAKAHQGTPLFSRFVVSSYKGPILLVFGCGTGGLLKSTVVYFDYKKISIQLSECKDARSHTLTFPRFSINMFAAWHWEHTSPPLHHFWVCI